MSLLRILVILLLVQFKAYALIEVDITRGNLNPLPIAVSPLSSNKDSYDDFEKILKKKDLGSEISIISHLFSSLSK